MAGEGKRTYRRAPGDVAEAKFIQKLIADYLAENTVKLAQDGKHAELYAVMGYDKTWSGIVADLTVADAPAAAAMPEFLPRVREPDLAVDAPMDTPGAAPGSTDKDVTATGGTAEPEGGKSSRRTPR